MKIKQITFILITLLISLSCKKISTPDEESKAIFGKWQYSHVTGGLWGAGGSFFLMKIIGLNSQKRVFIKNMRGQLKK